MPVGRGVVVPLDPLRCALVPAQRLVRVARLLPVVREQGRSLVELVGVQLFEGPRHRRVAALASLQELRVVGHLLGQRVLEGVLRLRVQR